LHKIAVSVILMERIVLGKLVMKAKSVVLAEIGCVLMFLAGCGSTGGNLPPEVAGIWLAYDAPWVIELSPDGNVVSAMIPMGEVEIGPNQTTEAEMLDGQISMYEGGDCPVEYNPQTRELTVTIAVKAFHVKFYDDRIDGNSTDTFMGRVSEDGRTWYADWYSIFDYGPRFPMDANEIYSGPVLFEKVIRRPQAAEDSNTAQDVLQDEGEKPADSNAAPQ